MIAAMAIVGILCIIFFPLAFIWCVNTLFGCGIDFTLLNWFAALVLMSITSSSARSRT